MNKSLNYFMHLIEYLFLLILGGSIYYGIEIVYRGYSHVAMFFVGGLCLISIGLINERIDWNMVFWKQLLLGDVCVLLLEFVFGVIFNIICKMNIWDYSNLPFNLLGQICLLFAVLWIPIIAIAIFVDDWVKYLLFNGRKPAYRWTSKSPMLATN